MKRFHFYSLRGAARTSTGINNIELDNGVGSINVLSVAKESRKYGFITRLGVIRTEWPSDDEQKIESRRNEIKKNESISAGELLFKIEKEGSIDRGAKRVKEVQIGVDKFGDFPGCRMSHVRWSSTHVSGISCKSRRNPPDSTTKVRHTAKPTFCRSEVAPYAEWPAGYE